MALDIAWHPRLPPRQLSNPSEEPDGAIDAFQVGEGKEELRARTGTAVIDKVTYIFPMDPDTFTYFKKWWNTKLAGGANNILFFDPVVNALVRLSPSRGKYQANLVFDFQWNVAITAQRKVLS